MSDDGLFKGQTFFDRYARGELTEDDADHFISQWHAGGTGVTDLHDFLGLSWPEYAEWIKHDDALDRIVRARREGRPVEFRPALDRADHPA